MATLRVLPTLTIFYCLHCTASLDIQDNDEIAQEGGSDGSNDSGESGIGLTVPSILTCESVLLCDSRRIPRETVTMPRENGGYIADGVYKAIAGVTQPSAMIFKNGRYSHLSWNLLVGNGTYDVEGDFMITYLETACSPNSEPGGNNLDEPIPTRYRYTAEGDELFLEAECFTTRCDPVIRLKRVDSLCAENSESNEECTLSSCSCHELVGQTMPNRAEGEDQCAIAID